MIGYVGPIQGVVHGIYDGPHATPPEADSGPVFLGIKNVTPEGRLVGSVYWSATDFWPIDTVNFIPKDIVDCWLYLTLRSVRFQNTDASVPGLIRNYAYSRKVMHPNADLRRLFNEFAVPTFLQRDKLEKYNRNLAQTRNMLLPRLMNGEISA